MRECGRSATLASYATEALIPAGRLFAERGYEGTTLCDLAEAASIAKATLFHYFSTKEKFLFEQNEAGFITGIDILADGGMLSHFPDFAEEMAGFVHHGALLDRSGRLAALLNTIARTGTVLGLFTAETPVWGVTEVATTLGLPKSTTFDLLASLAQIGLLQHTSDDRYRLGWQLLVIRRRLINSLGFNDQTQRTIAELAQHLNATITIGACDGRGVVCIANTSVSRTGPVLAEGARLPRHASALGKLLMAQLPWPKLQERIEQYGLPALTVNSVSDIEVFRKQLTCARENDLAVEHGETVIGQSCLAVGIRARERRVIAALSICTPTETMYSRQDEFARIARRAAGMLSARIVDDAPATA